MIEEINKLVPKLRFPEFRGIDWKKNSLCELIEIKGRIGYRGYTVEDIVNKGEGAISLSPSNISETGTISFEKSTYIKWHKYDESPEIMLKKGFTVLVKTGSTFGKTALIKNLPEKCTINPQIVVLKPVNIHEVFLFLLVSHQIVQKQINETVVGGAIPTLSQDSISKFQVFVPIKAEQQKIADCLSSLDDLISAQNQKLEALKTYKKGMMQQLFPAEGKTVPQLRFPEFRDSGDWEENTLNQVANYENGKAHEQDIVAEGDYVVVNSKFISSDGNVSKYTNTAFCLASKGDILMVLSDVPNGKAIAKCFFVDVDNLYSVNQRICKIQAFDANSLMLFYILNRNPYFLAFDDGIKQTNLRNDDVLNFQFLLPKNIEEQQKIADCLSSLDEQISAQKEKIAALKQHKKGLMQGLFPG